MHTDEVGDVQNLDMWLDLNGQRMQTGNTKTMIFGVAELISHASRAFTLLPGDVILTGTPEGVGPVKAGQRVEVEVPEIGVLANTYVALEESEEA